MGISRHWLKWLRPLWPRATELPDTSPLPFPPDSREADTHWMRLALNLARKAEAQGEVPVGAVLVQGSRLVATGYNQPITLHDPTAHAEILALRQAGQQLKNYRLLDTTLYVTLEPCAMCMTALVHARVKRLVFGADDPKRGAVISALQLAHADFLNHRVDYQGDILADECSQMLKGFFRAKR
ncbi:MAG: hypothetical protein RLZZ226_1224 [Pseudomonadota bacterium]